MKRRLKLTLCPNWSGFTQTKCSSGIGQLHLVMHEDVRHAAKVRSVAGFFDSRAYVYCPQQ
ncbi:hypothetical protein [Pasteurella testudinis]|uniref:hypothetical protein n=1 Tax=Pasteurella testudinis TaxID=761 RepID=UPI000E1B69E3|nr:hypothetical protein [Pasteurella testudinis]